MTLTAISSPDAAYVGQSFGGTDAHSDPMDKSVAPGTAAHPQLAAGSASRVIVFDWDDTLMASSWIDREKLLNTPSFGDLSAPLQEQFGALEEHVGWCLAAALKVGTVVIITNAEAGWVEYSAKRFMPRLLPLLQTMRVVSARSTYERFYPGAPLCWKAAAFAHEANQVFSGAGSDGAVAREIISFGDSNEERTAVKIAAGQLDATAKSIKFVDLPNPEQLRKQVETVTSWLTWVCSHTAELDLMLMSNANSGMAPKPVSATSDMAEEPWRPPAMRALVDAA